MCVYEVVLINILVLQLGPSKQKFLAPPLLLYTHYTLILFLTKKIKKMNTLLTALKLENVELVSNLANMSKIIQGFSREQMNRADLP